MDNQDRQNTVSKLNATSEWTMWKTKDKEWSPVLQKTVFHQILNIHKDKQTECWGFKIKGWWQKGDIHTTKKMYTQLTWTVMKNCTGWVPNQDFWGPFGFEGASTVGMVPETLQRGQ